MKKRIFSAMMLILTCMSSFQANGAVHETEPYSFDIKKDAYMLHTNFQISSDTTYNGSVKKSKLRVRVNYDLSDEHGWQATGIKRVASLGIMYPWAGEIDLYDTRGVKFGMIDGQVATTEAAKFSLYAYDEEGDYERIGIAYLNSDMQSITILYSDAGPHPIARLERKPGFNQEDYWNVEVYHPEQIDDRLVRIFAAFALDHQDAFLVEQPEEQ